ncbi:CMRF35-like molecule 1 isoform X2 [Myxocyprinus asiaticus]|nr:CMRF35-like molecule 1 isoform X2 [Myxocyprinus asiaticus]
MWNLLVLFACMITAVGSDVVGTPTSVFGYRKRRLDIRCLYKFGYETNSKYFCKGECFFQNKNIIIESGSPAEDERFSLTDDTTARVVTVSITDLRTEDEGKY